VLGVLQNPDTVFGGLRLVEVENCYVLYKPERCKMWALVAAEQQQKCIETCLMCLTAYGFR